MHTIFSDYCHNRSKNFLFMLHVINLLNYYVMYLKIHCVMGRRIDPSWMDPLSYFSFQPVLHDWCNKGCGMVHKKEPLLLIGKCSPLSELSFTICPTPYSRK